MSDLALLLRDHALGPLLARIGEVAAREEIEAYAVGGVVRDVLLGRPTTDVDIVTVSEGSGPRLAEAVRGAFHARRVHLYEAFGTAAVRLPDEAGGHTVEFVTARRESYRRDSRKPDVEAGSLADDLARRDFTVNALAVDLAPARFGALVDDAGGLADLDAGLLRTPLDPRLTFDDDPLRMVRAARFAAQLGFRVDEAATEAMYAAADRIAIVSMERVEAEMQKLLMAPVPSVGLFVLYEGGLLPHLFPEVAALAGVEAVDGIGHKDNLRHTFQVVDHVADRTAAWPAESDIRAEDARCLRWAALLHDVGKARTRRFVRGKGWTFHGHDEVGARMVPAVFRRLKLPLDERLDAVRLLVRLHHRPHALVDEGVTDSAVRRLLFDAGERVDDLMTLVRADLTSKNPKRVARYLKGFDRVEDKMRDVEARDHVRTFQPPLRGEEIMAALGVGEGLAVGIVKERIKEAILDGEIANDPAAAIAYMDAHAADALRRGALFDRLRGALAGPEKRTLGHLRDLLATAHLPEVGDGGDDEAAWAFLMHEKDRTLAAPPRSPADD